MSLTLNTPAAQVTISGFDVRNVDLTFVKGGGGLVVVVYVPIDQNGNDLAARQTNSMTEAQFVALPGTTPRLKALAAVAQAEGLAGGSYSVA